jgi:hypothetical protein
MLGCEIATDAEADPASQPTEDALVCRPTWNALDASTLPDPKACAPVTSPSVVGNLDETDPYFRGAPVQTFCVCLAAGEHLSAQTATVVGLSVQDAVLYIIDPTGVVVAQDDDSGGHYQAAVRDFVAVTAGAYMLAVTSHAVQDDYGDFELIVSVTAK